MKYVSISVLGAVALGLLLLDLMIVGSLRDARKKIDQAINFAYEVCEKADVEGCDTLHERWLPDDVLAEELYRYKLRWVFCIAPINGSCTIHQPRR